MVTFIRHMFSYLLHRFEKILVESESILSLDTRIDEENAEVDVFLRDLSLIHGPHSAARDM